MLDKVGIFIEDSKFGGPQKLLINIFKDKSYFKKIRVFISSEENFFFKNELKKNQINFEELKIKWPKKNIVGIIYFFINFIKDINYIINILKKNDLQKIYVFGGASNIRSIIAAKILKKKIIWHFHETKINLILKYIISILYSNQIKIIFSSVASKIYYKKNINIKNYQIIPSGIDINYKSKFRLKKQKDKITITNVSNINEDKNLEFFIKIANYCYKRNNKFQFKIFGNIWSNKIKYYQNLLSLIDDKQKIKIIQGTFDINKIHKDSDIYLCTSINESSPMAVWEAMSLGIILFTTQAGEIKYQIKDGFNGFLIKNSDVERNSEKLIWISQNLDKLNSMRMNAIKTVKKNFDIKKIRIQILKILK